ncbi:TPM domain-containing protein [Lacisediminimonas profundi]|uniref:TPM domain-containing protein n=1 Tax=Lacisediminimonas profundi TaxID=2603856 RepID=UPI00124BC08A|nr:TPM domain-containing protein [Lacisediminimonas profundi]
MKRLFRHLTTTSAAGRRAFPPEGMKAIQAAIARGEKAHRAEIRLMVEPAMSFGDLLEGRTARHRARALFTEYRIWDTEENCGILVYINLADRMVEIVADRGVNKLLEAAQWQQVCRTITAGFAAGRYDESVVEAIDQLNGMLHADFPAEDHNPNELPNRPLML